VQRCFTAERPDRLWVAQITYVPTLAGFLFLAVVMDVFSRRIVGWAMAAHLRTELILDALNRCMKSSSLFVIMTVLLPRVCLAG
jgi:putative transposase